MVPKNCRFSDFEIGILTSRNMQVYVYHIIYLCIAHHIINITILLCLHQPNQNRILKSTNRPFSRRRQRLQSGHV